MCLNIGVTADTLFKREYMNIYFFSIREGGVYHHVRHSFKAQEQVVHRLGLEMMEAHYLTLLQLSPMEIYLLTMSLCFNQHHQLPLNMLQQLTVNNFLFMSVRFKFNSE